MGATTHFGSVFTVRDGVKRRRKEICAATDGDSLSIYEVRRSIFCLDCSADTGYRRKMGTS